MSRINLITKKDLVIEPTRGSGPGGQHRNKNFTGVRITHPPSGAIGEATDSKSQETNKRNAFLRMVDTLEFKVWMDLQLHPEHLKIEVRKGDNWYLWDTTTHTS
jgi:protein subunit release factor A